MSCRALGLMNTEVVLSNLIMCCLAIIMVAGGTSLPSPHGFLIVSLLSLLLLATSVQHFYKFGFSLECGRVLLLAGSGVLLVVLQLVPLPPALWVALNGRQGVSDIFTVLGEQNRWMPLSLTPATTLQNCVALLPGLAAFVSVQLVSPKNALRIAGLIAGIALANIFIALVQNKTGYGFFVNQNFYAAQIYGAIAFVVYIAMVSGENPKWIWILAFLLLVLLVAAIGATGSRLSLGLAALSILVSLWMALKRAAISYAQLAMVGVFLVVSVSVVFFGGSSVERMTSLPNAFDFRSNVSTVSLESLGAFFPFGSGFGSFASVYQMFETPQMLQPQFINHAHNDWLELLVEGGLPMLALMLTFVWWFYRATLRGWQNPDQASLAQPASITIMALLIHSGFDYPLRTASLMALFGLCCGLLAKDEALR
jgi:O-antigen ligase